MKESVTTLSENLSGKGKINKIKAEGNFGAIEGNLKVYCDGPTHRYN